MCINYNVMCKAEIILGVLHRILILCVDRKHLDATTHPPSLFLIVQSHSPPENEISPNPVFNVTMVNQYVHFFCFTKD